MALGLLLKEELYRSVAAKALVGQPRGRGQQPGRQFSVKGLDGVEPQVLMLVHDLLSKGLP